MKMNPSLGFVEMKNKRAPPWAAVNIASAGMKMKMSASAGRLDNDEAQAVTDDKMQITSRSSDNVHTDTINDRLYRHSALRPLGSRPHEIQYRYSRKLHHRSHTKQQSTDNTNIISLRTNIPKS
jgi:hypothetical protein